MKSKGFYAAALIVCALGMSACAGEKGEMPMQAENGAGKAQREEPGESGEETERKQEIPGTAQDGRQPQTAEAGTDGEVRQAGGEEKETAERDSIGQEEGQEQEKQEKDGEGQGKEEGRRSADGKLYIYFQEEENEHKAEDGTVLLKTRISYPVTEISGNGQAADAINAYIKENGSFGEESIFTVSEEEAVKWAEEDYAHRGKDNWYAPYEIDAGYTVQRMDEKIISFEAWKYSYTGGAHPNNYLKGLTFDARTGKRLMLEDVVEDMETASAAVLEFLSEETKKEQYGNIFFSGYEKDLPGLFSEDNWYLGEDGFHIIANTYSIAPYVAGSFDFVIPYGEADFLKPEVRNPSA